MQSKTSIKLSSNMEDYLEAIVMLKKSKGVARVRDISRLINVKTPSVSGALSMLAKNGLVVHERYGYAELTAKGQKLAKKIKKRHDTLSKFLTEILNIEPKIAAEDACKMEHAISPYTFGKLTKFLEFVKSSPAKGKPHWLKGFGYYVKTGKRPKCVLKDGGAK
ncbi:MAG: metal-dependent transcriptional regulator [Candidatus Omnitrophica bacterium]|nr:metal-dependent transcriptional regulator [Candidatus Omnitrophota bacterium]